MEFLLSNFISYKRWCCENTALNMPANLENSAGTTGLEKVSFHSNPKAQCQRMFKLLHNCTNFTCLQSNAESSPRGFNSTWTENFQMLKQDLEKAAEPEMKLPTSTGPQRSKFEKTNYSAVLTMPKLLTVWITTNCAKLLKRWEYQTTFSASWEISRSNS